MYSGDVYVDNPRLKFPSDPLAKIEVKRHTVEIRVRNAYGVSAGFTVHDFEERTHQFRQSGMNRMEAEKALDDEVFKKLRKQLMIAVDEYMSEQADRYTKDIIYGMQFSQDKKHEYDYFVKYSMRVDVRVTNVNGRPVPQDVHTFLYDVHERTDCI